MKIVFNSYLLFFLGIILCTAACKGDDDGAGFEAGSGTLTATVDGASWESKDEVDGAVFASTQGTNVVQAYTVNDSYISLTFFGSPNAGDVIETDGGMFQANYKPEFMGSDSYMAVGGLGSGTLTITNFSSSNVAGTFQFTGQKPNSDGSFDEKVISNGSFDIDF